MSKSLLSLVKSLVSRTTRRTAPNARPATFRPRMEALEERLMLWGGNAFQTNSLPGIESGRAAALIGAGVNPYVGYGGGLGSSVYLGASPFQIAQPVTTLAGIGAPGGISMADINAYFFGGLRTTSTYGGYGYGAYSPYVAYSPYGGYSSYTPYGSYSPFGGYGGYSGYGLLPSQNPVGYGVSPYGGLTYSPIHGPYYS
jgi:hypothetical protein